MRALEAVVLRWLCPERARFAFYPSEEAGVEPARGSRRSSCVCVLESCVPVHDARGNGSPESSSSNDMRSAPRADLRDCARAHSRFLQEVGDRSVARVRPGELRQCYSLYV